MPCNYNYFHSFRLRPKRSGHMAERPLNWIFLEPSNFLFNRHKGKLLTADEFLRNIMEQECSIPREVSDV